MQGWLMGYGRGPQTQGSRLRVADMTKLSLGVRRVASSLQFQLKESRSVVTLRGKTRTLLDKHSSQVP